MSAGKPRSPEIGCRGSAGGWCGVAGDWRRLPGAGADWGMGGWVDRTRVRGAGRAWEPVGWGVAERILRAGQTKYKATPMKNKAFVLKLNLV
jgi:hypothetical protein